ncbi:uncharacterized protein LOC126588278 [Malus sylvestris]|uniref:uncharacterized protein LOC126588278 n=1 Tax=Malus sylvestris TaxID=3752 RepID=UPI0021AC5ACC|nr:uncharacterized protein LOC126588278 [Malus sylvestris]
MIVLVQLFRLIINIHFSSGVDLDTLFEALEQLYEPQLIDPNIFNPTEPKIYLPRLRRQWRLKIAAKAGKSRRRSCASVTGYQRVPDSGASACRQVSASVTPAGATQSSAIGSLWMICSTHIPFALILSAATLSRCAVRPPSLALGVRSCMDAAISGEVDSFPWIVLVVSEYSNLS